MNNPEYCQNIYEAAKKVVKFLDLPYSEEDDKVAGLREHIENLDGLKRALEGKENV